MTKTVIRKLIKGFVLTAGALVVLWFGFLTTWLSLHPSDALLAFTTEAYPAVPQRLAGAVLRFAPYDANDSTISGQPLLHTACAVFGLIETSRENSIRSIRMLVANGAHVNSRFKGLAPLHEAILYSVSDKTPDLVSTLLELGADPSSRIVRPGKPENGLTAMEYAILLGEKHPEEMRPIIKLLRSAVI